MHTFETFRTAISVKLNIPGEVTTFGGISLVASELNQVESQRKKSGLPAPRTDFGKQRGYRLTAFEVRSPAQASVFADPSWLAVYIGLLALGVSCLQLLGSYSNVKSGAKELATDLSRLKVLATDKASEIAGAINALSDTQRRDLLQGIQLYIDAATNTVEKAQNIILRATRFASILRRRDKLPELEVRIEPALKVDD